MGININTNIGALQSNNRLGTANKLLQNSLAKLASGKRINAAKDDAAGLAISEELNAQIRGLAQAERNTMDGISMVQTAEGGLNETGNALIRMRELAVQAGNGTLSDDDRANIDAEMSALKDEINRISGTTDFNGTQLLDGSAAGGIAIQVGAGPGDAERVNVSIGAMDTTNMGTDSVAVDDLSVSTSDGARQALGVIDAAIGDISSLRGTLGAKQNVLNVQSKNLANRRENLAAANSRIRDTDIAAQATEKIKNQILMQSSAAISAQANQLPAMALSLIG
ncbi:MAG: flagellin FliC [Deltaproteobacteria bacterium]|nr:flagellin FliC [Deltaproteobacteria bacterium]